MDTMVLWNCPDMLYTTILTIDDSLFVIPTNISPSLNATAKHGSLTGKDLVGDILLPTEANCIVPVKAVAMATSAGLCYILQ